MEATLVTGASAGLGVLFARRLAAQKQNLVLVARRKPRLKALAKELRKQHGVEVEVVAVDLAAPGAAAKLMKKLAARDIHVATLINNAGFGLIGSFAKLGARAQQDMITVNITALTDLCHAVLPAMIKRKSGGILNVGSTAAFQAGPGMAVYYATKAYVLSFSEALHEEVKKHGIKVSCLCPGPTKTEFFDAAKAKINLVKMAGAPEQVVDDGLAALAQNKAIAISGTRNKIGALSTRLVPRAVSRSIAGALQKQ